MTQRPPGLFDESIISSYVASLIEIHNGDVERFQAAQKADAERQELVNKIMIEHHQLLSAYADLRFDFKSLQLANRAGVQATEDYEKTIQHQRRHIDELEHDMQSSPLVGVFVDGDGAKFQESLIKDGISGGEQAAHTLQESIRNHLREVYPGTNTTTWKIMVVVIASMDNLGYAYQNYFARSEELQGVNWLANMRQFSIGFNRGAHHTFSFVDIGGGKSLKELTDTKLKETFTMMLPHCKHVFFAGCHDSGYVSFLGPYKRDPKVVEKLTLIETHNTNANYYGLGFRMTSFPDLFRSADFTPSDSRPRNTTSVGAAPPRSVSHNHVQPHSPPKSTVSQTDSAYAVPPATIDTRSASATPSGFVQDGSGWNLVTKAGVTGKTIDITPAKKASAGKLFITLNRDNERVDPQLPPPSKAAEQSFAAKVEEQGQNFCNRCNVAGTPDECDWTDSRFKHGKANLTKDEFQVLRSKVRSLKCSRGSECHDFRCGLGHHCRSGKNCYRGYKCTFADTHHMDIRPYKKIYEDGSQELLN